MAETKVTSADNFKPNSFEFFNPHFICWRMLGVTKNINKNHRISFIFYSLIVNAFVTVGYPLHLALRIFRSDTQAENFNNLAIVVNVIACSIKFLIYAVKLPAIYQLITPLQQLDERINDGLEMHEYGKMQRRLRTIALLFALTFIPVAIVGEIAVILRAERTLLYPAWFPFNWIETTAKFVTANLYQIVGLSLVIVQNLANDCFPPMALCMLSGHIKMLSIRVANIGYDEKSLEDNEEELNRCVKDQNNLYELFATMEGIISLPVFVQLCVTATVTCVTIGAVIFYVTAAMDYLYYVFYFLAIPLEVFPICYFGSDFQMRLDQLHTAVYESNWIIQSVKYKKHMMLFTERSLKQHSALAGGMIRIHLDTFVSTCRFSYSLFAILMRMR